MKIYTSTTLKIIAFTLLTAIQSFGLNKANAQANNDICAAIEAVFGDTIQGNNASADAILMEAVPENGEWKDDMANNTLWYAIVPPETGVLDIELQAAFDAQMAVYEMTDLNCDNGGDEQASNLSLIAASDTSTVGAELIRVCGNVTENVLFVQVDGFAELTLVPDTITVQTVLETVFEVLDTLQVLQTVDSIISLGDTIIDVDSVITVLTDSVLMIPVDSIIQVSVDSTIQIGVDSIIQITVDSTIQVNIDSTIQITVDSTISVTVDSVIQISADSVIQIVDSAQAVVLEIGGTVVDTLTGQALLLLDSILANNPLAEATDSFVIISTTDSTIAITLDSTIQVSVDSVIQIAVDSVITIAVDSTIEITIDSTITNLVDSVVTLLVDSTITVLVDSVIQIAVDSNVVVQQVIELLDTLQVTQLVDSIVSTLDTIIETVNIDSIIFNTILDIESGDFELLVTNPQIPDLPVAQSEPITCNGSGSIIITTDSSTNGLYQIAVLDPDGNLVHGAGITSGNADTFNTDTEGLFTISVVSPAGCRDTLTVQVDAILSLEEEVELNFTDTTIVDGELLNISVESPFNLNRYSYQWENDISIVSGTDQPTIMARPSQFTVYQVVVQDRETGCGAAAFAFVDIEVRDDTNFTLVLPNTFTPNGDGENDFYKPYGAPEELISFVVIDRWGGILFVSTPEERVWDGKDKRGNRPVNQILTVIARRFNTDGELVQTKSGKIKLLN